MVVIAFLRWPPESGKEIGKRFMEGPPLPDYLTRKGPYIRGIIGEAMEAINIYEFDGSRFKEAFEHINERMAVYFGVPGFTYSIEVCIEAQQGLRMVGLA